MEKWRFGLSRKEVMQVVGDFVRMNGLVTPFKDFVPGADWFINFRKRHNLSIKKPQSVEYARKKMTDPFVVQEYFQLLRKALYELQLYAKPDQICNMDETSFSMDESSWKQRITEFQNNWWLWEGEHDGSFCMQRNWDKGTSVNCLQRKTRLGCVDGS